MTNLLESKVIGNAVKAQLENALLINRLSGVVLNDVDLKGFGKGMKKQYTSYELSDLTLQVLERGDEIKLNELGQTSFEVTIDQIAHGKKYYKRDLQTNVDGSGLANVATEQTTMAFSEGIDNIGIAALTEKAKVVDAEQGLNVDIILDEATKKYGEKVFSGELAAFVVHPLDSMALRKDPNFEKVVDYGYANATYGRYEIGRLYGQIPVVLSNKVLSMEVESKAVRNNILVPKGSLLTLIGQDLDLRIEEKNIDRSYELTADIFIGVEATKEGIVFQS